MSSQKSEAGLRVLTLFAANQRDASHKAAEEFLLKYPQSLLGPAVNGVLKSQR